MKRAGLYVRVSTAEQKNHGLSVDNQIKVLSDYCKANGYEIHDIYNDAGISARKSYKNRPELLRMIADCQKGLLDLVLFTRLDRFSRNVGAYYSIVEQMNNVPWKAVLEDYETETPDGVFKVNIMLSVAQSEADKTAARLKDSYQYRKAKGIFYGKPPTGYTVDGGKLIKDPKTKDGVQAMFNTYLKTLSAAKTIQVAGEYGIPLYKTSLKKILKNQTYCGMTENGHLCEPYITPEQHDYICKVKHSRRVKQKYPDRMYIFSGVVFCGYCGRRMQGKAGRTATLKDGTTYTYLRYVCKAHQHTNNPCPCGMCIAEHKLESILLSRLDAEIGNLKYKTTISQRDIAEKMKERKRLENKLERAKEMYIEGDISKDVYKEKKYQITRELDAIHIERQKIPKLPKEWKKIYSDLTAENKRLFWKKIIEKVVITRETKETPVIFFRS